MWLSVLRLSAQISKCVFNLGLCDTFLKMGHGSKACGCCVKMNHYIFVSTPPHMAKGQWNTVSPLESELAVRCSLTHRFTARSAAEL